MGYSHKPNRIRQENDIEGESMSEELALEKTEETPVTEIENSIVTPMTMLQSARAQGASLEQMQQLMEMQFQWEANEARKAYFKAVAEFKAEEILVTKDKKNKQYGSRYSSKGNLVNTVNPILSKYGLSANWKIEQGDTITVSCILSHSQGHSDSVSQSRSFKRHDLKIGDGRLDLLYRILALVPARCIWRRRH